jgi:DNA-binding transcriptional ArsR family regulator
MVNSSPKSIDLIFHALSDSTRRAMLLRIAEREHTITELAGPLQMSMPAVCKHVRVLESAGLLVREKDGRIHRCTMNVKPLNVAMNVIQHYQKFWGDQLDALEDFLNEAQSDNKPANKRK